MKPVLKKIKLFFGFRNFKRLLIVFLLSLFLFSIVYLFYFLNNQTENNALNLNDTLNSNLNKNNLIENNFSKNCCAECLIATNRDPSGYDISIKECSTYDLSKDCENYFLESKLRVGQCG